MNRARQAVMVAMMATALCADRATAAAPPRLAAGGQSGELADLAGRFVGRLGAGFVRARVSATVAMERNSARPAMAGVVVLPAVDQSDLPRAECWSPFQFRLPPPAIC
jgi:hypothetical protein